MAIKTYIDSEWRGVDQAALAAVPFYCEENVARHLIDEKLPGDPLRRKAVFISNPTRSVAMWQQRAVEHGPVIWDYHVVALIPTEKGGVVIDVDCRSGPVLSLSDWLLASFRAGVAPSLLPQFRVVSADDFHTQFASDRSHMLDNEGNFIEPPPPWPVIGTGPNTLMRFVDLNDAIAGNICSLPELIQLGRNL